MKKWLFLLLVIVALGVAAYYWLFQVHTQPLTEKALTFAEVRQTTIRDVVSATGLVEPREIIVVSSEMLGTIVRLKKRVGETVYEGEELAELDRRKIDLKKKEAENGIQMTEAAWHQARASLSQAKAALLQAEKSRDAAERYWETQKKLENVGGIRSEREQAEAQYHAANAGIKAA